METKPIAEPLDVAEPPLAGCLMLLGSALFACFLLFLNGAIVMAVIDGLREAAAGWVQSDQATQFVVLFSPVVMLVAQWWLFDWLHSRLSRRTAASQATRVPQR